MFHALLFLKSFIFFSISIELKALKSNKSEHNGLFSRTESDGQSWWGAHTVPIMVRL